MPMTTPARTVAQLLAIADAAEALLRRIEDMTTDDFAVAREKPERDALARALGLADER